MARMLKYGVRFCVRLLGFSSSKWFRWVFCSVSFVIFALKICRERVVSDSEVPNAVSEYFNPHIAFNPGNVCFNYLMFPSVLRSRLERLFLGSRRRASI